MKQKERPVRFRHVEFVPTLGGKAEGGNGFIEGYASVFGVIDSFDEVVMPGAFTKTLGERVPAGKVKLMATHIVRGGGTAEVIGTVTEAKEDERGLWMHAELASTALSADVRKLVVEGHVTGLSIGYEVLGFSQSMAEGKDIIQLTELRLLEVTVTPFPANEEALITAAKALKQQGVALSPEHVAALRALLAEVETDAPEDTPAKAEAVRYVPVADTMRRRLALLKLRAELEL